MDELPALPDGDYAIVALFGHTEIIGRIAEAERFGAQMIRIEPVFRGALLGPVWHGGAAIYGITPIPRELAAARCATSLYQLPHTIRALVPAEALPPPEPLVVDWDAVEDIASTDADWEHGYDPEAAPPTSTP